MGGDVVRVAFPVGWEPRGTLEPLLVKALPCVVGSCSATTPSRGSHRCQLSRWPPTGSGSCPNHILFLPFQWPSTRRGGLHGALAECGFTVSQELHWEEPAASAAQGLSEGDGPAPAARQRGPQRPEGSGLGRLGQSGNREEAACKALGRGAQHPGQAPRSKSPGPGGRSRARSSRGGPGAPSGPTVDASVSGI